MNDQVEVYINGLVIFRCDLSLLFTRDDHAAVPIDAEAIAANASQCAGRIELGCALRLPAMDLCGPRNTIAALQMPWGTWHYLGPVSEGGVIHSARYVAHVPDCVRFVCRRDNCLPHHVTPPYPCEMLLKEHVRIILDNEEFCGSLPSAHVQNLVRGLPFYKPAMERFCNWTKFVQFFDEHYHAWAAVRYGRNEHRVLGLTDVTPAAETRLVSLLYIHSYQSADQRRDRVRSRALTQLRNHMTVVCPHMTTKQCCQRLWGSHVGRISSSPAFKKLNTVNYMNVVSLDVDQGWSCLLSAKHPVFLSVSPNRQVQQSETEYTAPALIRI